ncbi:MAG TPA: glycosyltransferase family 4 protein [Ktedonobacterales bacterium]
MGQSQQPEQRRQQIAVIGNYLPRQCGIATFTTDFCEALAAKAPEASIFAIPVNDTEEGYAYPPMVRFELEESDVESYRRAADFINLNGVDLVVLQHEYGIFGGIAGSHILALLRELHMPIVTVLHTVLREPDRTQRKVLAEIAKLSDRLVVMSEHAVQFLTEIYEIPEEKIAVIPHGIPDVPFVDPNFYKDKFDAEGRTVLLTFGLLSPNKGIENVIAALPAVVERYPDILYIVLGATHPHVVRHEGEAYRLRLQQLARELGVEKNVVFYNQFVRIDELVEFIGAADMYITPYLNGEQIVSGTLAYTVGTGKAVISTPYWYAEELLADERGVLVPFKDPAAIAKSVIELLENEAERHAMRKRAFIYGREMTWPQVAERYLELFQEIRDERSRAPRSAETAFRREQRPRELPPIRLGHLRRMTNGAGLLQHAIYTIPNYDEGYSIDDNARALIAMTYLEELGISSTEKTVELAARYLAFINFAFNPQEGRFRNFLSYGRDWLEEVGSEDSHGRALWALGTVVGRSLDEGLVGVASPLFERALPAVLDFEYPRAWAFALLGIDEYLKRLGGDRGVQQVRKELASRLVARFEAARSTDWLWFEDELTYDNATLARALLLAGAGMGKQKYVAVALTSLKWLMEAQRPEGAHFVPIGCNGFYPRGEERARFDQQPVEAFSTVAACLDAYRVTGNANWRAQAQVAFDWFLGQNDLHLSMIDPATGGCYDGLRPDGVNRNQGAESTLAYLLSLLELRRVETELEAKALVDEEAAVSNPRLRVATASGTTEDALSTR